MGWCRTAPCQRRIARGECVFASEINPRHPGRGERPSSHNCRTRYQRLSAHHPVWKAGAPWGLHSPRSTRTCMSSYIPPRPARRRQPTPHTPEAYPFDANAWLTMGGQLWIQGLVVLEGPERTRSRARSLSEDEERSTRLRLSTSFWTRVLRMTASGVQERAKRVVTVSRAGARRAPKIPTYSRLT